MGGRYSDVGVAGLGCVGEGLASVGHVSLEQRDRARNYVFEEAELRYPEEWENADRREWLDEMLGVLGLHDPAS